MKICNLCILILFAFIGSSCSKNDFVGGPETQLSAIAPHESPVIEIHDYQGSRDGSFRLTVIGDNLSFPEAISDAKLVTENNEEIELVRNETLDFDPDTETWNNNEANYTVKEPTVLSNLANQFLTLFIATAQAAEPVKVLQGQSVAVYTDPESGAVRICPADENANPIADSPQCSVDLRGSPGANGQSVVMNVSEDEKEVKVCPADEEGNSIDEECSPNLKGSDGKSVAIVSNEAGDSSKVCPTDAEGNVLPEDPSCTGELNGNDGNNGQSLTIVEDGNSDTTQICPLDSTGNPIMSACSNNLRGPSGSSISVVEVSEGVVQACPTDENGSPILAECFAPNLRGDDGQSLTLNIEDENSIKACPADAQGNPVLAECSPNLNGDKGTSVALHEDLATNTFSVCLADENGEPIIGADSCTNNLVGPRGHSVAYLDLGETVHVCRADSEGSPVANNCSGDLTGPVGAPSEVEPPVTNIFTEEIREYPEYTNYEIADNNQIGELDYNMGPGEIRTINIDWEKICRFLDPFCYRWAKVEFNGNVIDPVNADYWDYREMKLIRIGRSPNVKFELPGNLSKPSGDNILSIEVFDNTHSVKPGTHWTQVLNPVNFILQNGPYIIKDIQSVVRVETSSSSSSLRRSPANTRTRR
jgi:hypothetical protein